MHIGHETMIISLIAKLNVSSIILFLRDLVDSTIIEHMNILFYLKGNQRFLGFFFTQLSNFAFGTYTKKKKEVNIRIFFFCK